MVIGLSAGPVSRLVPSCISRVLSWWMLREYDLLGPLEGVSGLIIGVDKGVDLIGRTWRGEVKLAPARALAERMENHTST